MATPLSVSTDHGTDGTSVLTAAGEVDLSNIDVFARALDDAARDGAPVTVDLTAVEYVYSGAINALFDHVDHIGRILAHPFLIPALTVSGLTSLATVERNPPRQDDASA